MTTNLASTFNISNSLRYPKGKEAANQRITGVAVELKERIYKFFSDSGYEKQFDVNDMEILDRPVNLSLGKADVRCVICEIAEKITTSADDLLKIAVCNASRNLYTTRKSQSTKRDDKGYDSAVRFIQETKYNFSKMGILPHQISKGVYEHVIWIARVILISLWREGLVLLPISANIELSNGKIRDLIKFKTSKHRSKPPMFNAPEDYVLELQTQFEEVFFNYEDASPLEKALIKRNLRQDRYGLNGEANLIYCSSLYSLDDISLDSYNEVVRILTLKDTLDLTNIADAALFKELTNDVFPMANLQSRLQELKTLITTLGGHKSGELAGHTKIIVTQFKSEIIELQSFEQFNFHEVVYEKDEQALFDYFSNNSYSQSRNLSKHGLIEEPDYHYWDHYKERHLRNVNSGSINPASSGWNVIYQYLTYVSCWCIMFPEQAQQNAISTPTVFKEMDRDTFVIRNFESKDVDSDTWPRSLGEFLLTKNQNNATWVKAALESIETNFGFDKKHVGSSNKMFLEGEFTKAWHLRERGVKLGSLSQSVKKVFKRDEFSIVLQIAYSLEAFGAYLQERALSGTSLVALGFRPSSFIKKDNPYRLVELNKVKIDTPIGAFDCKYKPLIPKGIAQKFKSAKPLSNSNLKVGENHFKKLKQTISKPFETNALANVFYCACPLEYYTIRVGETDEQQKKKLARTNHVAGVSPISWYVNDELKYSYVRLDSSSKLMESIYGLNSRSHIEIKGQRINIPLLGVIRGFIVALEQGIRHKHIRFLDARHFDNNVDPLDINEIVDLIINTDKSRKTPWVAPAHIDVIKILRQEREFLRARTDVGHLIPYNDSDEIDVLFRNQSGEQFKEAAWAKEWSRFMNICQSVINSSLTGIIDECEFVKMVPQSTTNPMTAQTVEKHITEHSKFVEGAFVGKADRKQGFDAPGHSVKLLSLITPHSTRTTFISHRIGYMPLKVISESVGHVNLPTTQYYHVMDGESVNNYFGEYRTGYLMTLKGKKAANNHRIINDSEISNDDVKLSYESNSHQTKRLWGFTSVPLVTVDDEGNEIAKVTGLDLIDSTPRTMIAYSATHICIHNLECPKDIVEENGGFQRCGVCRIKISHIDNLVSISRLLDMLELDLSKLGVKLRQLNSNKVSDQEVHKAEVNKIKQGMEVMESEFTGWTFARETVERARQNLLEIKRQDPKFLSKFVVPAPKLLLETVKCEQVKMALPELFMTHMSNMSDVPSLNSPELSNIVPRIERQISIAASKASPDNIAVLEKAFMNESLDPRHIMAPIISMIDLKLITKEQVYSVIEANLSEMIAPRKTNLQKQVLEKLMNYEQRKITA